MTVERTTWAYGDHPSQFLRMYRPLSTAAVPVIVVIHGGFWRDQYGIELAEPLAADLAGHGVAALAIEYRRVGSGGGWPATLLDVAAAVDSLAQVEPSLRAGLDLGRVVAIGHSAGGQLAVWLSSRSRLSADAPPALEQSSPSVTVRAAVSQGGVLDLAAAARLHLGADAVQAWLGAQPEQSPDRYAMASPIELLAPTARVTCVHGTADEDVPVRQSRDYVRAGRAIGADVRLVELPGVGHMELVDADDSAWSVCRQAVLDLL